MEIKQDLNYQGAIIFFKKRRRCFARGAWGSENKAATKDGSGWLNIRIIRIRIRLKCKYGYPYSYSLLIWMSYGCIRIRL